MNDVIQTLPIKLQRTNQRYSPTELLQKRKPRDKFFVFKFQIDYVRNVTHKLEVIIEEKITLIVTNSRVNVYHYQFCFRSKHS